MLSCARLLTHQAFTAQASNSTHGPQYQEPPKALEAKGTSGLFV